MVWVDVGWGGVVWGGVGWDNSIQLDLHTYVMLRYRPALLHLHTYLMLRNKGGWGVVSSSRQQICIYIYIYTVYVFKS